MIFRINFFKVKNTDVLGSYAFSSRPDIFYLENKKKDVIKFASTRARSDKGLLNAKIMKNY